VLNARIRKRWRMDNFPIGVIGEEGELRYGYEYLGAGTDTLSGLIDGSVKFGAKLRKAKRPMIIVGQGALSRPDGLAVLSAAARLSDGIGAVTAEWNGLAVLHTAAARVGGLDLGFVPGEGGKTAAEMLTGTDVLFLLGADEMDFARKTAFTVYIGSHGDNAAHVADVILPGAAYTEKSGTWVNTEGRVQMGNRAGFAPGDAREDWAAGEPLCRAPAFRCDRRDCGRRCGRCLRAGEKRRDAGQFRVCVSDQRLLFDEPDSARLRGYG
jgi:NADH-quinone oxidoreductase subunit G